MTRAAKVLTVSDGVASGHRDDTGGRGLVAHLGDHGFEIVEHRVIPDGRDSVSGALTAMTAGFAGLVATTGGTGFGPRDLTPEGTPDMLEREAPGLAEAMRAISPFGRLSRGRAGAVGTALVINLPGSPSGAVEHLDAVIDVLGHALDLLAGTDRTH